MKYEDIQPGKVYFWKQRKLADWVVNVKSIDGTTIRCNGCVDTKGEYFYSGPTWGGRSDITESTIRLATVEEEAQLRACIMANKYVEAAKLKFDLFLL